MGLFCVYKHTSPSEKIYIGITSKKPENRWNHGKAYWQNKYFTSAIHKYGWDNFKHEILFQGLSKEEACKKEIELISKYQSNKYQYGYNLSSGGENPTQGSIQKPETIERRRRALIGKKRSIDTCKAISDAKKGKSNGLDGRTGNKCAKAGIVLQIDEVTNKVISLYYGYYEMSRMTGYAQTPVKEVVSGKRKRAYGFLWQYKKRGNDHVVV